MLTINSRNEDHLKALELGADDYVLKPFNNDVLLARIMVRFRVLRQMRATS